MLTAAAFDESWSALDAHPIQVQPLVLLQKPYGVEAMRATLQKAAAGRPVPAPSIALEAKNLTAPGTARLSEARRVLRPSLATASARTSPLARARPVSSVRPAKLEPPLVESTLTCSEFQAQMAPLSGQPFFCEGWLNR